MQIAAAVAQPVTPVQPPFDLYRRSAKPGTNFFSQYSPAISIPADGVILGHPTGHAHTQDLFQVLFPPHSSMGIACLPRGHGKTLLPLGKKARLQK